MINIPSAVAARLKTQVPRFQKILASAKARDINEADTVAIVADMLEQIFGMDKYSEVTREFAIRGTYVDLAVKTGEKIQYLIEVKAIGLDLKDNHLRQAVDYAAKEGVAWVIITNGIDWQLYRVEVAGKVESEFVAAFNLLDISVRNKEHLGLLFLLCRRGIKKDSIADYYERQKACDRFAIGALLRSDEMLNALRRNLKRITPGVKINNEEIKETLTNVQVSVKEVTGFIISNVNNQHAQIQSL